MAKYTTAQRKRIPKKDFGLPEKVGKNGKNKAGRGAYPITDPEHARVAKAYASKELKRGNLTASQKARIDAKANKMLGKSATKKAAPKRKK